LQSGGVLMRPVLRAAVLGRPIAHSLSPVLHTAALDPAETDAYYWVTTDIGTGHTEFSRTYEEHQQHVRTLQRYCASNPGVC
ncbi:hypothetical protein D9C01_13210, partial [Corynebacterium diphtheriae]